MTKQDCNVMIFCSMLVSICVIMISVIHNMQISKLMNENKILKEQNEILIKKNTENNNKIYEIDSKSPYGKSFKFEN